MGVGFQWVCNGYPFQSRFVAVEGFLEDGTSPGTATTTIESHLEGKHQRRQDAENSSSK